ncbi:MAG: glycerol acyltransferase [Marinilabiliales bacterium]|nr:MAG: glycerol acyltransferase [Marinilabiliales bacterium]
MEKVNVREVFKQKNPKVAKWIPGFIFKYIERIVHQKEINEIIPLIDDKYGLDYVKAIIDYFKLNIEVKGEEFIPTDGRNIFVANHPLGGLDGIVFAHVVGKKNPKIQFLVNDILMTLQNLDSIFIPVNKHGRQSMKYVRKIEETYKSDQQILNFPAGLCSRKIKGSIIDLEWKKSFVSKAIEHKRDIVPVHISGRNSNFFYNLSNLRGKLGIKANLEMFYLVDEVFKQKNKNIVVTFGKPISYTKFDKSESPRAWAKKVKDYIYTLPQDNTKAFKK